jgi:hypothetical protein
MDLSARKEEANAYCDHCHRPLERLLPGKGDQTQASEMRDSLVVNISQPLLGAQEQHLPIMFLSTCFSPDRSNGTLFVQDFGGPICIDGSEGEHPVPGIEIE